MMMQQPEMIEDCVKPMMMQQPQMIANPDEENKIIDPGGTDINIDPGGTADKDRGR